MNKEVLLESFLKIIGILIIGVSGIFILSFLCSFIYFLYRLIRYKEKEPIISNTLEIFGIIMEAVGESGTSIHYSGSSHSSSGFGGGSSRGGGAGRSF